MNLKEFNSLIDLFFYQVKKQNPSSVFLEWLNPKNKKKFSWSETALNIYKLAKILRESLNSFKASGIIKYPNLQPPAPHHLLKPVLTIVFSG